MIDHYKEGYVHVIIPLNQVASNSLGFKTERLWAKKLQTNQFQVKNIPFYVKGISYGDIIEGKEISEDVFEFVKIIKYSGHSTFRIYVNNDVLNKEKVLRNIINELNDMGVKTEGLEDSILTAIDVPSNVDISKVGQYLNDKYRIGLLDYEESSIPQNYVSFKNMS